MKRFIVVAYDVEDDRRRRQVAKLLEASGRRVNKSVFECYLSDSQLAKLKRGISRRVLLLELACTYFPDYLDTAC